MALDRQIFMMTLQESSMIRTSYLEAFRFPRKWYPSIMLDYIWIHKSIPLNGLVISLFYDNKWVHLNYYEIF